MTDSISKTNKPIMELKDVFYSYTTKYVTVEAVRGVSYTFEKGRFYAIQGASGSGKTTLLSIMAGLDYATKGNVLFDGVELTNIDTAKHRRENVSVIYQNFNLLPQLTVAENVMYPMELMGIKPSEARKRASEYIELVGLTKEEFVRFPATLSGGQQQRVAIARALGTTAKVILADEPTGNLDKENTRIVINILQELAHDKGYCVIVVTHDATVADSADVKLLMEDGKLIM